MNTGIIIIFRHGSDFAGIFYTRASNTTSALSPLPRLPTLARRVQIGCHGPRHSRVVCRRFGRQSYNGYLRVLLWAISRMVKRTHHHIWVIFAMWHTNVLNHGFVMGFMFVSILLESIHLCHGNRLYCSKFSFSFLNTRQDHVRLINALTHVQTS